jgi:hypothetical protein
VIEDKIRPVHLRGNVCPLAPQRPLCENRHARGACMSRDTAPKTPPEAKQRGTSIYRYRFLHAGRPTVTSKYLHNTRSVFDSAGVGLVTTQFSGPRKIRWLLCLISLCPALPFVLSPHTAHHVEECTNVHARMMYVPPHFSRFPTICWPSNGPHVPQRNHGPACPTLLSFFFTPL